MLQSLDWIEPLDLAAALEDAYFVLLYSGVQASYSGRYSYLACELAERIESDDFSTLAAKLSDNRSALENAWFGYLSYDLKDSLENLTHDVPSPWALPKLCMMRFHRIYRFDHAQRKLEYWSHKPHVWPAAKPSAPIYHNGVNNLQSNMSTAEYLEKVSAIIRRIHAGDLYQANLTRKFSGRFQAAPAYFELFRRLCTVAPAPYSAFIRLNNSYIASSSPEQFINIGTDGHAVTRPIKGTAPRFSDQKLDDLSREALSASAKDRAENLMIVDLMRNDLAKTAIPGSIQVERLFEVTSHATIHHMSSTITALKQQNCSTLDMVKQCFPPGSMTGAPKIAAMKLCRELEHEARGVYAGALGWFGGDGSGEFSVIIRTLILRGDRFEFQVGGGIVADSIPEQELKETIAKARGILTALGLSPDALHAL